MSSPRVSFYKPPSQPHTPDLHPCPPLTICSSQGLDLFANHVHLLAEEKDTKLMSSEGLEATEEEMQEALQDLEDEEGDDMDVEA